MTVRLGIDTDAVRAGATRAKKILGGLGKTVAALGVGLPAVAALGAGVGGLAAMFASAGAAALAFKLAVGPQMQEVASVADLAAEAQKAAAEGAEDAAEKQKAYTDALAQLPPATQETARAFIGLKKDYGQWSDSLSGSTMPVFTRALQLLRRLLPLLTPFVKAAAAAFGAFVDEIDRSTRGKGLEKFADSMAKVAGRNLQSFLFGLKNIAVGIGGIIKAFMPLSDEMSGGFEESTAAFAAWGQGLSDSKGFAEFIALAKQGATTLGTLATTALVLLQAFAPLIGLASLVALHLSQAINAMPPSAVQALAYAVLAAVVAYKSFALASRAVDTASDLMSSRLGTVARRWVSTAATAVKAQLRIAAGAARAGLRTAAVWAATAARATATWLAAILRIAAATVARYALMAGRALWWAARMAASWFIAMGPIGWVIAVVIGLVALIIANWDTVKAWTGAAWDWIWQKIQSAVKFALAAVGWLGRIPGWIGTWFTQAKDWAIARALALVAWLLGLPGRVRSALAGLLGVLRQRAVSAFTAFKDAAVARALALLAWMAGLPGRALRALGDLGRLLFGAGKALIQGFINGIKNMLGNVRDAASDVVSAARDFFPFSPAKEGPFSGRGYTLYSGRALAAGFGQGIQDGLPGVQSALDGLGTVPGLAAVNRTRGGQIAATGAPQALTVRLDGADPFLTWLKERIRIEYGGDVTNLNTGR
ncbi:hypothetical protein ACIQNG_25690 [Streptomyces sp. NPDC091377]|uniref:hypothetical protein n=1 Tax=Streptomyces sp. NPDC091377 TaxID=3365995 RepID=UPI0037F5DFC9